MAKFSDYIKCDESKNVSSDIKQQNRQDSNSNKISNKANENLEEMINKYSSLDNNSLMQEFLKLTIEKKKKGELDMQEINSIKNTLTPYLNKEQRDNLEKILNVVNNV